MKRFLSWTATDARNETFNGSLVSLTDSDFSGQRRLPRKSQRIPIVFLGPLAEQKEQPVQIRSGTIKFPRKPVSKKQLLRRGLSRAVDKVVAQVSNLLYRRFPIGRTLPSTLHMGYRDIGRLEALRYSRLETCATPNQSLSLLACPYEQPRNK